MDKNSAINLIKDTFNAKFDESKFTLFIKNFLNDLEPKSNSYSGNLLWDDYKEHINSYKRIGKYTDPEGDALDVLIVQVKTVTKLQKARTTLRNFVIKHLSKFDKDYALVAFYSKEDEGADWRFSFIKLEHQSYLDEEKQKVKTRKEFTPAKRYSFLVGEYEDSHTAKNQLLPLLQNIASNPTLEELETAFSIEKVTDEFFGQYKDLFVKLSSHFENDEHIKAELKKANINNSRFTKKLLGQIVFLYFLQKKGWLGVPENETWGKGQKRFVQDLFDEAQSKNKNYFKDYLQPLFYEALAKERSNENSFYKKFNCRIPFLNGGLFEAEYNWQKANISIPENLFRNTEKNKAGDIGTGVLDVFDRYNFTIKEDEPLDKEVAVDPEMLGKVFENMLDITERKRNGAFYTPREIVHYMCQESLIHYLDNSLENKIRKADIETYIRKGHFALENDIDAIKTEERIKAGKQKKTGKEVFIPESIRQNADLIDQKLTEIRICDPAIGSGAFPVGLLHELVNAQLVLKPHLSNKYLNKKLDGFGFQFHESINESRYVYRLKRHIIQESIYGVDIDASAIDIARLRLWLSLVVDEDDLDPIETLPNLDYKIVCGNSLIGMPENSFRDLEVEKELEALKEQFYNQTNESKKKALRTQINTKIRELLDSAEQFAGYKIDFDFKLYFSEVWHEKGGFDVVIGNPPYISYYGNKGQKLTEIEKQYFLNAYNQVKKKNDRLNSMNLMTEKGVSLLNSLGFVTFITNKTLAILPSYVSFREYLLSHTGIDFLITNLDPFDAIVDCVIFGIQTHKLDTDVRFYTGQLENHTIVPKENFESNSKLELHQSKFEKTLTKIEVNEFKLEDFLTINRGVNIGGCFDEFLSDENKPDYYKYLGGTRNIKPFCYEWDKRDGFFKFDLDLEKKLKKNGATIALGNKERYEQNRLFIPESGQIIMAALSKEKIYGSYGLLVGTSGNNNHLTYALFLLNSEIFTFYTIQREILRKGNKATPHVGVKGLRSVPVPDYTANKNIQTITDYLGCFCSKNSDSINFIFLKSITNSIVYELYFPEELKSANKEILKYLGDLKPITDEMSEEEKLAIIQSEFERLYDPNHPVRNNIETLDSIEEVRIIKEALK